MRTTGGGCGFYNTGLCLKPGPRVTGVCANVLQECSATGGSKIDTLSEFDPLIPIVVLVLLTIGVGLYFYLRHQKTRNKHIQQPFTPGVVQEYHGAVAGQSTHHQRE